VLHNLIVHICTGCGLYTLLEQACAHLLIGMDELNSRRGDSRQVLLEGRRSPWWREGLVQRGGGKRCF